MQVLVTLVLTMLVLLSLLDHCSQRIKKTLDVQCTLPTVLNHTDEIDSAGRIIILNISRIPCLIKYRRVRFDQ